MDPVFQMFLRYRVGVNAMRPNGNCQNSTATEFIVYTVSGRVSAIFFCFYHCSQPHALL